MYLSPSGRCTSAKAPSTSARLYCNCLSLSATGPHEDENDAFPGTLYLVSWFVNCVPSASTRMRAHNVGYISFIFYIDTSESAHGRHDDRNEFVNWFQARIEINHLSHSKFVFRNIFESSQFRRNGFWLILLPCKMWKHVPHTYGK